MFCGQRLSRNWFGQLLINRAIRQANKHGFDSIFLGTVSTFKWAHRFYEKLGFHKIKATELPNEYESDPLDSVFFRLELNQQKP